MFKLVTVVGARPQFIKAAVVSRQLRSYPDFEEIMVHTGQHYDGFMSDVFFKEMDIPNPKFHLGIGSGPHGAQTGRMLEALEGTLLEQRPDWVLVYGDTNSTLAGALASVKLHIPVAHVEAGLRSFNRQMPEEINRVLTDHMAELLFAPTQAAVENLRREGIQADRMRHVGDVMYDAALHYAGLAEQASPILDRLGLESKTYVLATIHRAENTDDPVRLGIIVDGLARVGRDLPVVLPLHPRTRAAMEQQGLIDLFMHDIRLMGPVGYLDMIMLEKHARLIVTDSGGVQKEAFFHHTPCVTLRQETEWVELVELKWNTLCPPLNAEAVAACITTQLQTVPPDCPNPYGDGKAAASIIEALQRRAASA
jgi:UDP-GlcNAc3NAcA epimerase